MIKQPNFVHVDTNSQKLRVDRKFLCWASSEFGHGQIAASLVSGL